MLRILIQDDVHTELLSKVTLAETATARLRGLLGRSSLPKDTGLLLRPCRSIHMWFMRFPIDAVFLDAELRVLRVAAHLQPWQVAWAPRHTHSVLETHAGVSANLTPGTQLRIEEKQSMASAAESPAPSEPNGSLYHQ